MQTRHTWTVHLTETGANAPGSLPWYVATPAYRLAERLTAEGVSVEVRRDGQKWYGWKP